MEDKSGQAMQGGEMSIGIDRPVGNMGPIRGNSVNRRQSPYAGIEGKVTAVGTAGPGTGEEVFTALVEYFPLEIHTLQEEFTVYSVFTC